jgi:hypothetical protein
VIELALDNVGIGSEKVTGIYELDPDNAPKLPGTRSRAARVGVRGARRHPGRWGDVAKPNAGLRMARIELRCVQRARGDVAKLLERAR